MPQAQRALVFQPARLLGTMFEDSWKESMWRATWILFLSFLIPSTQAQGKETGGWDGCVGGTGSAWLGSVRAIHWRVSTQSRVLLLDISIKAFPLRRRQSQDVFINLCLFARTLSFSCHMDTHTHHPFNHPPPTHTHTHAQTHAHLTFTQTPSDPGC